MSLPTNRFDGWGPCRAAIVLFAAASVAAGQPGPSPPSSGGAAPASAPGVADQPAQSKGLTATITGIDGGVQVRANPDAPWQPAQLGMVLGEGAEFRTMPRSAVRFTMPPDQTVTLDRLGTVKLVEAVRSANKVKTNLGMKYGRTRYDVEAGGVEHEASISTPSATLAIRGTHVNLTDDGVFPAEARSLTGRAVFTNMKRQKIAFGEKGRKARIDNASDSAADHALNDTFVDTVPAGARTDAEKDILLAQSIDRFTILTNTDVIECIGSFLGSGSLDTIDVQTNRTRAVPGTLAFDLHWTGAADLDLNVTSPAGEKLVSFPIALDQHGELVCLSGTRQVGSGGRIDFEDEGPFEPSAPSNSGRETAYWTDKFPKGKYVVTVQFSGGTAADLTLDVIKNGQTQETHTQAITPGSKPAKFNVRIAK